MSSSEIDYMNEVPDGGAIRRVPVGPKDIEHWSIASQDRGDDRDEIAGFLSRIFA